MERYLKRDHVCGMLYIDYDYECEFCEVCGDADEVIGEANELNDLLALIYVASKKSKPDYIVDVIAEAYKEFGVKIFPHDVDDSEFNKKLSEAEYKRILREAGLNYKIEPVRTNTRVMIANTIAKLNSEGGKEMKRENELGLEWLLEKSDAMSLAKEQLKYILGEREAESLYQFTPEERRNMEWN